MTKRPTLFGGASAPKGPPVATSPLEVKAETQVAKGGGRPTSRLGKRVISIFIEPEAAKRLAILAIEEHSSIQALGVEAINDLFAKRSLNRIA